MSGIRLALRMHENWIAASVFLSGVSLSLFINNMMMNYEATLGDVGDGCDITLADCATATWAGMPSGSYVSGEGSVALISTITASITSLIVMGLRVYKTVRQDRRIEDMHKLDLREREVEVVAMEVGDD